MNTPENKNFFPTDDPNYENIDRIFQTLEGDEDSDYVKLTITDQFIWNVCHFESAYGNGALYHYFTLASSDHWRDCLQAFKTISAEQSFDLLKRACERFPDATPGNTWQIREQQLAELGKKFGVKPWEVWDELEFPDIERDLYTKLWNYYEANQA